MLGRCLGADDKQCLRGAISVLFVRTVRDSSVQAFLEERLHEVEFTGLHLAGKNSLGGRGHQTGAVVDPRGCLGQYPVVDGEESEFQSIRDAGLIVDAS